MFIIYICFYITISFFIFNNTIFKSKSGLWYHKQRCDKQCKEECVVPSEDSKQDNIIQNLQETIIKQNKIIIEQNKIIIELSNNKPT